MYLGPGMGGGFLAVILGVLMAIFLGITSVFWKPIKVIIRKIKGTKEDDNDVENV